MDVETATIKIPTRSWRCRSSSDVWCSAKVRDPTPVVSVPPQFETSQLVVADGFEEETKRPDGYPSVGHNRMRGDSSNWPICTGNETNHITAPCKMKTVNRLTHQNAHLGAPASLHILDPRRGHDFARRGTRKA